VRLGICIAAELALAASVVAGLAAGAAGVARRVDRYLAAHASAREGSPVAAVERSGVGAAVRAAALVAPLPRSELRVAAPPAAPSVFGASDAELLEPLGAARVVRAKWNLGGSSVSLRLDFANGTRAAFKPEQIHTQSDPRRELAAFRVDRLLGIGRVPPAKPAAIPLSEVIAALDPAVRATVGQRLREETIARDGVLHGELSWWIPEIRQARIGRFGVDEPEGRALWISYLQPGAQVPPAVQPLVAQLAACVVFDVIVDNADRWSGNNVVTSPDGDTLYIMDNTMTFSRARIGHEASVGTLQRIRVFPRGLVARLRALTEDQLTRALAIDAETGLAPLLSPEETRAVLLRRDRVLEYIDRTIAAHGEAMVLALP
jgi:hypothetical protein